MKTEDQVELMTKSIDEHNEKTQTWAKESGVVIEPIEKRPNISAIGVLTFTSAGVGKVRADLTFAKGEKWQFNGISVGDLVGLVGGQGEYRGWMPKAGEKWHFNVITETKSTGGLVLTFTSDWWMAGQLFAGSVGDGAGKLNYGGGNWTKG